ncbi:MAG: glutathione S-transferase family protein [Pseudomonadota bacterium]
MTDFVVYGVPASPFVRKTEVFLHHVGAPYDFEMVNIMGMPDWFLKISPAKRIPVLRDKTIGAQGVAGTIADSSAIALFLERRFDAGLFGKDAYEAGRIAWFEEFTDTSLAVTIGMEVFRPLVFPVFAGNPPDLEKARKGWNEKLPPLLDYFEASLEGKQHLVGDAYSHADIALGAQMSQLNLVTNLPDAATYPNLIKHTEIMMTKPGFAENLGKATAMLAGAVKEKVKLD